MFRLPIINTYSLATAASLPVEVVADFNVHGVRLAVNRITGEILILHNVHAADNEISARQGCLYLGLVRK